ncbi:protein phosphatase 2C domain-containing protein [Sansalvadorimonas sp. 2012CJ34-2]|uniref:Protein phosphatase 2C domain-containing protein n=1 Tax=Parendozoicomonas callyspongiae TaxID=2942213 RepID=A0ABT0PDC8_9GAMM|nr:protein phosphatase 2C domain-containing protein [Sansalvadorimonas sp. 2012CJ34-2]
MYPEPVSTTPPSIAGNSPKPSLECTEEDKGTKQVVEEVPPTVSIQSDEPLLPPEPVIYPGMSINMKTVSLADIQKEGPRYVDWIRVPTTFATSDPITPELLDHLDYQVVGSDEKVRDKLRRASESASSESRIVKATVQECFNRKCEKKLDDLLDRSEGLTTASISGPWGGCFVLQNSKGHMTQDEFTIGGIAEKKKEEDTVPPNIGLFDGHGLQGEMVAKMASLLLVNQIQQRMKTYSDGVGNTDTVIWNAHKNGFTDSDRLVSHFKIGGSTATLSSFYGQDLWTAQAGDSHQLLIKPDGTYKGLTEQASPGKIKYLKQIERRGGRLNSTKRRIKNPDAKTLAMAKSIGDHNYQGCSNPRPQIVVTRKPDGGWNNHYLLLGSDGFWKVTSDKGACAALKKLHQKKYSASKITRILALVARASGSHDDISVALVDLNYLATGKKSVPADSPSTSSGCIQTKE